MANDIWTPPTNWNTATDFTEVKAEAELTDDMHVLSLAIDGDTSTSTIKHRHRRGTYATLLTIAAGEAGRLFQVSDMGDSWFVDDGTRWQPLWEMVGRDASVLNEDFVYRPKGDRWVETLGANAVANHTSSVTGSIWLMQTANVSSNSLHYRTYPIIWGPGSYPAWFETKFRDLSASRAQCLIFMGLLNAGQTEGIFFMKSSGGAESGVSLVSRIGGVDTSYALAGTTGSSFLALRWVLESPTLLKAYVGDALAATHSAAVSSGFGLHAMFNLQTTEAAVKQMEIDYIRLLSRRA